MPAQQNNLSVLYLYCKSFFIRDVQGEFGLINVHLFDTLPAISCREVGDFFVCRVVILLIMCHNIDRLDRYIHLLNR